MKMPSRDAYGDELEDSDCIPRLLEDVQSVHVVSSYFAHANPPRRLFHSAPPIVRRLFEGGVYSRAASIRGNTVIPSLIECTKIGQ